MRTVTLSIGLLVAVALVAVVNENLALYLAVMGTLCVGVFSLPSGKDKN